jgi:hypothetical protein
MTKLTASNGWNRLSCGCDLELRHGVPIRLSSKGEAPEIPAATLSGEVTALTGLHVSLEEWLPGEEAGEVQARIRVTGEQLTEVLNRLALSAAALFFDRYHKPVDSDDVDWDTLEFANDFRRALDYCGLDWKEIDRDACKAGYLKTMHTETLRLAAATESPRVEPESD